MPCRGDTTCSGRMQVRQKCAKLDRGCVGVPGTVAMTSPGVVVTHGVRRVIPDFSCKVAGVGSSALLLSERVRSREGCEMKLERMESQGMLRNKAHIALLC